MEFQLNTWDSFSLQILVQCFSGSKTVRGRLSHFVSSMFSFNVQRFNSKLIYIFKIQKKTVYNWNKLHWTKYRFVLNTMNKPTWNELQSMVRLWVVYRMPLSALYVWINLKRFFSSEQNPLITVIHCDLRALTEILKHTVSQLNKGI